MASQITNLPIVYLTVCSGADQRKHQSSASLAFVREIPRTKVSNAESVSIRWRHHDASGTMTYYWKENWEAIAMEIIQSKGGG